MQRRLVNPSSEAGYRSGSRLGSAWADAALELVHLVHPEPQPLQEPQQPLRPVNGPRQPRRPELRDHLDALAPCRQPSLPIQLSPADLCTLLDRPKGSLLVRRLARPVAQLHPDLIASGIGICEMRSASGWCGWWLTSTRLLSTRHCRERGFPHDAVDLPAPLCKKGCGFGLGRVPAPAGVSRSAWSKLAAVEPAVSETGVWLTSSSSTTTTT